ncbi:MAG: hypothetical protein H0W69_09250 [Gemmatimonadaceae bacterium]|nr:hypothetical protein [Gemmatimonadaceae bacterium]
MSEIHLSERTRNILAMSREESASMQHEYIGTEHILLAFLREKEGVATTVLRNLNVDRDALRDGIMRIVEPSRVPYSIDKERPFTSRAQKVLELAISEAQELGQTSLGPEHLLIGLIAEEKGIAAQVLLNAGLNADAVRAQILEIWS